MSQFLTANGVSELYGETIESVYMFIRANKDTEYTKKIDKKTHINITKLLELKQWRMDTLNKCHSNYYKLLLDYKISDAEQARQILAYTGESTFQTWCTYIYSRMFESIDDIGILATRVSKLMILYNQWSEHKLNELENQMFKDVESYPNIDLTGFDSVDDYYSFHEALKLREKLCFV